MWVFTCCFNKGAANTHTRLRLCVFLFNPFLSQFDKKVGGTSKFTCPWRLDYKQRYGTVTVAKNAVYASKTILLHGPIWNLEGHRK